MVYDLDKFESLYGFGAIRKGGITVTKFTKDYKKLLVAGDDPESILLHYE